MKPSPLRDGVYHDPENAELIHSGVMAFARASGAA